MTMILKQAKTLPITLLGMDILRKKTKPVKSIDAKTIELIDNMFHTMENAYGIGIAAPQVNVDKAIAVADISYIEKYKHVKPIIMINPVIAEKHGEIFFEEGCLSIPNIRAEISRPKEIFLKMHDMDMNEVEIEVSGFFARVIQHEIDHLNGKLFLDYMDKDQKQEIKSELAKIRKGKTDVEYPILFKKS